MNYTQEVENIGGNGFGGGVFGGGSWGLIILLFLFFSIFCGGGLFGNRENNREEPRNWQVDRDILETRYSVANQGNSNTAEIIANQNAIDQRRADRELVDAKNTIAQMQTIQALTPQFQHVNDEISWLKNHTAQKPEVYAAAYLPSGVGYPNRGLGEVGYY